MDSLEYRTLDRSTARLDAAAVTKLATALGGGILTERDLEYDRARTVWNGMIDRRPALIARCRGAADVCAAVDFARTHRMLVSVRGGGHHIAGNAVAEAGLMIDLSAMRDVRVDAANRTARLAAGALLSDLDREAQVHGLATPLGINSTTGVAGLCLGGGFGWLSRTHGLTIDNLLSADVVTADGRVRTVSATQDAELFWAIRGGGGNFGVVTSFEFRLHAVGPEVYAGLVVFPFDQARRVLRAWRDFTLTAPDALSVWPLLRKAPPLPFLPEEVHGTDVVVLAVLHAGDVEAGRAAAAPILEFGAPIASALAPQPYAGFQGAFDPLLTAGARNYWKSHNFASLSDEALEAIVLAAAEAPEPQCEIFIAQLGGAVSRVAAGATAYAGRDAHYVMNIHGRWLRPGDDQKVRDWTWRAYRNAAPFATGGGYVNFLTDDERARTGSVYGGNYERLQAIKRRYDPDNLFRMNQNIVASDAEVAA